MSDALASRGMPRAAGEAGMGKEEFSLQGSEGAWP